MCCTRLTEIRDAKNRHLRTIAQLCRAISSQLKHVLTIRKKPANKYLPNMSLQYGKRWSTKGDLLASLGHSSKFQRVSRLSSVTAWHCSSGRQPNFVALNRGRHLYSAGRISRCVLAHILVMDALCNSAGIIFLSCGFFFFFSLFFFPRLISAVGESMPTILIHRVALVQI